MHIRFQSEYISYVASLWGEILHVGKKLITVSFRASRHQVKRCGRYLWPL